MQPRTRRQRDVLEIITRYIENNGHLPSYQMIAHHLGVRSKSSVAKHVDALVAQGLVRRRLDEGRFKLELCGHEVYEARSRVVEWFHNDLNASEDWEKESFAIPNFLLGIYAESEIVAFRIPDESLSKKNVCEGDIALVEKRTFAREGSLVLAVVSKGPTVLRSYYRVGSSIELRPSNDDYENICASADSVSIVGIFRALIRPPG